MKWYRGVCLLIIIDCTLKWAESICVLDSDFGFNLNCGFKKSGLFRVRNLGGVKGYVGLGFSVGDELGFGDSLSNTDTNKRRSVATARSANITGTNSTTKKRADNLRRSVNPAALPVPPFKPIPPASHLQSSASPRNFSVFPTRITISNIRQVPAPTLIAAIPVQPPSFQSLPSSITKATATVTTQPPPKTQFVGVQVIPAPIAFKTSLDAATKHFQVRKDTEPASSDNGVASNTLSLRQLGSAPSGQDFTSQNELDIKASLPNAMSSSIKLLAQATNLSEDAIAAAIAIRQKQLLQQQQQAELALATSTTKKPLDTNVINKYPLSSVSKVMNAPREYYPVGYDKNFDDNFASRVELPDTSFYCGDQKHFPGLYADEDLGCMVFHVCAFTDDGLIMKSFLCPESTLFDQSILKCNWWFYVDCKSSKKLYDSNIPISKSYQLMKALAFFSSYNKQ